MKEKHKRDVTVSLCQGWVLMMQHCVFSQRCGRPASPPARLIHQHVMSLWGERAAGGLLLRHQLQIWSFSSFAEAKVNRTRTVLKRTNFENHRTEVSTQKLSTRTRRRTVGLWEKVEAINLLSTLLCVSEPDEQNIHCTSQQCVLPGVH